MFSKLSFFTMFMVFASSKLSLDFIRSQEADFGLLAVFFISSAVPMAEVQVERRGCGRWACMDALTVGHIFMEYWHVLTVF